MLVMGDREVLRRGGSTYLGIWAVVVKRGRGWVTGREDMIFLRLGIGLLCFGFESRARIGGGIRSQRTTYQNLGRHRLPVYARQFPSPSCRPGHLITKTHRLFDLLGRHPTDKDWNPAFKAGSIWDLTQAKPPAFIVSPWKTGRPVAREISCSSFYSWRRKCTRVLVLGRRPVDKTRRIYGVRVIALMAKATMLNGTT